MGLGGGLNFAAIAANDGVMPASPEAVEAAGLDLGDAFENSLPVTDPNLLFLGDVFATPGFLPVDNVYAVGDVLIALGALVCLHHACASRPAVALAARLRRGRAYRASGSSGTGVSPE